MSPSSRPYCQVYPVDLKCVCQRVFPSRPVPAISREPRSHLFRLFQKKNVSSDVEQGESSRRRFLPHQGKTPDYAYRSPDTRFSVCFWYSLVSLRKVRLYTGRWNLRMVHDRWRPRDTLSTRKQLFRYLNCT